MMSKSAYKEKYLLVIFITFLLLGGLIIISPFSVSNEQTLLIFLFISTTTLLNPLLLLILILVFWQIKSEHLYKKRIAMVLMVLIVAVSSFFSCLQFIMPLSILDIENDRNHMYLLTNQSLWDSGQTHLYDCEWMMICNSESIPYQAKLGSPEKMMFANNMNLLYVLSKDNKVIYEYQR